MRAIDETGNRFGRLTAAKRLPKKGRRTMWLFKCDCGAEKVAPIERVKIGHTRSCGCLRREVTAKRSITHGHRRGRKTSREWKSWQHAKARCHDPGDPKFGNYGGRGISMCASWRGSFEVFYADMGPCPPQMTLDRIDVNGGYEPQNCRWANAATQARNRTDNVWVDTEIGPMILKDFAAFRGVSYKGLHYRIRRKGMTPHEAADQMLGR